MTARWPLTLVELLLISLLWATLPTQAQEDDTAEDAAETLQTKEPERTPLAYDYGFQPLELFKLTDRIEYLRAGDLNGDGRQDVIVVDNGQSRLDLLLQRSSKEEAEPQMLDVNEIEDLWRFEHKKVPVQRTVEDLALGDFNGDQRLDIAYTGENFLILLLGNENNTWTNKREIRLSDTIVPTSWRMSVGDLDEDGRDDIAILGPAQTLIVRGSGNNRFEEIERLPSTTDSFDFVWSRDLDGDKRPDLVLWNGSADEYPLTVHFQDARGKFGPEYRLKMPIPRAVDVLDLDGKPGAEILSIESNTGRVRIFQLDTSPSEIAPPTSPLVQFGFGRGSSGRDRLMAAGDLNGDELQDVIIVDGDEAVMRVYLQDPESGVNQPLEFPGLTGVRAVATTDVDNDGREEVVVASEREKMIGLSRWRDGRLSFPQSLPTKDPPLALCFADFEGNGRHDIAYVSTRRSESGSREYVLRKLTFDRNNGWEASNFNGMEEVVLEDMRSAPAEMLSLDADRDGRSDLLILSSSGPALFLGTNALGVPQAAEKSTYERLGDVSPGQISLGQLDGSAILMAQKKFTRRVGLDPMGRWTVLDQYNADSPNASIVGSAILDLNDDNQNEIVLVDTGSKRLRFLQKEDGLYRPWKELDIGPFIFKSLTVADFNNDQVEDLLLFGPDKFGIAFTGMSAPELREIGSFESQLKDQSMGDLIQGDLGGDKAPEIVLLDIEKNRIEIIAERDGNWKSALSFKVFEADPSRSGGGEPRQALAADVTGDGLQDLLLLCHDRILLYPQDPGPAVENKDKQTAESGNE